MLLPCDDLPGPLDALARVAHRDAPALLDGAVSHDDLGRWSVLAVEPVEWLRGTAADWPVARDRIRAGLTAAAATDPDLPPFRGGWIGWLGYELGAAFDHQVVAPDDPHGLPDFSLARYDAAVAWDHQRRRAWLVGASSAATDRLRDLLLGRARLETGEWRTRWNLRSRLPVDRHPAPVSNFTAETYRQAVTEVIARILAGEIFQANLSQRFSVPFGGSALAAYAALRRRAPGSHGAYLDHGDHQVLSVSPECFLRLDPGSRRIETRPIKGTRPRSDDPARDATLAEDLRASVKDRAENVMIVDLMRNDLNRVAVPGSVAVPALCRLESYATVHHLVSVVTAELRDGCDALDLLAATFPGGSITGAPKLRAMAILAELERTRRGPYCGAIGWIGSDGALALNVAIRTVTLARGTASVPAGGGVTALSDPAEEHRETLDKAAALLAALEEAQ